MHPVPSMSSSGFCFNRDCSELIFEHCRPGWRLRTGGFAELCNRCAFAYEQGKFCDVFHLMASGWRCCESCGKRIHCGCIVSASSFMLLDAGGVECLACAGNKVSSGTNFLPPPSSPFQSPMAEKYKDMLINWRSSTESNQMSCRLPSFSGPSVLQFDLHNRGGSYEFSRPTYKDRALAYSPENNRGLNYLMGNSMSENSKNHTSSMLNNQKAGPNCKVSPFPNVNEYHPFMSLEKGPCGTHLGFPVSVTTPTATNGHSRLDGTNSRHIPNSSTLSRLHNDLNGGVELPFDSKRQNLRTDISTQEPGNYQVVPRYWPKVSYQNQVLENPSKESKSAATLLFEKMLSASDTGRTGRLVVPKNCAEAFFPQISHPEGVPLKIQDPMGKEWIFQFCFWPNKNGRIYVLEGVTQCIHSMQLQAGDTVIFSRLDPERKLMIDFRKASVAPSADQETGSMNSNRDTCTNRDAELIDTHSLSKVKESAHIAKETRVESSSRKKKSSMMITRSKRQKVEKGGQIEPKLTWEEARGVILPPPNFTPSIVEIEECEFEEYEDAPIIGKPPGLTCSADQELGVEQHNEEAMEAVEGAASKATTKHPRHQIGCKQSPSGKGPKHDQCCPCTVCDTVKRRKCSLLLLREKKQREKQANALKEQESLNSDEELHQSPNNSGNTSLNHDHHASPLKGQIDLNFQPEKDEESLPGSETTSDTTSTSSIF